MPPVSPGSKISPQSKHSQYSASSSFAINCLRRCLQGVEFFAPKGLGSTGSAIKLRKTLSSNNYILPASAERITRTSMPPTSRISHPPGRNRDLLTKHIFYAVKIDLAYLSYLIFEPFLVPLAWAAILVVLFHPW